MISKNELIIKLNEIKIKNQFWTKNLTEDELKALYFYTSFLNKEADVNFRRLCLIQNIEIQPVCVVCSKPILKYKTTTKRINKFCSSECKLSEKGKQIIQELTEQTWLKKYNTKHVWSVNSIRDKVKSTKQKKYSNENFNNRTKAKKTNKERYGHETPQVLDSIKEKTIINNNKKYGVDFPQQREDFKITQLKNKKSNYWEKFMSLLSMKHIEPCFNKSEYINKESMTFKCLKCEKTFESNTFIAQKIYCPSCIFKSSYEVEIQHWISSLDISIETNKRFYYDGNHFYECDIYIPEFNLGIEFHDIYWHSELYKEKRYHQNKYLFFNERNNQLIQIFQNEWIEKESIVKSIILNLMSKNSSIWARKCEIKEIDIDSYRDFLESNHLQGYASSLVKLGLYYNNELVQVMSFGKSRFNKQYEWENIRTCTKIGKHVVGGFNRLLKYFILHWNPQSIISYVDLRYFTGEGYIQNDFRIKSMSDPNFFYFKKDTILLESRNKYQRHKLSKLLENYDENKGEHETMLNNDFLRIYDAGNRILVWEK